VSFPIAVQLHAVKPECPHTIPTTEPCRPNTAFELNKKTN
jgi:hypothetical protein